jgi:predicted nucleic acid-binding protein
VRKDERRRLPLSRKAKEQKSRGVVDTNVLIAGISGFRKPYVRGKNPSADVLYNWAEKGNFVWLVTEDTLDEYKEVLKRLRVRSTLIGAAINLIRERAEPVNVHTSFEISPDSKDDPFCLRSEEGNADFIVILNPKDKNGSGQRSFHPKPWRSMRRCRFLMNTSVVRFRTGQLRRQTE